MTKTINKATTLGIQDFAMVHDSYGTHSSSMPKLSEVLREEFVNMYEQHDVLTDLRQHAISVLGTEDIPHPPSKVTWIYVRCWNHHISLRRFLKLQPSINTRSDKGDMIYARN